jgi:hypothetical protein
MNEAVRNMFSDSIDSPFFFLQLLVPPFRLIVSFIFVIYGPV